MNIAAGAPVAGISLQARIAKAKRENLKFTKKNKFLKKNKHAPCRVARCE
jgi:hypothetical protein